MNYWFTADLHLGHKNILVYTGRPFTSVEEMDSALIDKWNEVVKWNDTIYCLGDFSLSNKEKTMNYFSQLNGKIQFIEGNHDYRWIYTSSYNGSTEPLKSKDGIITFLPMVYNVSLNSQKITMAHYSMRSWPDSGKGNAWHLFGHHHGRLMSYGKSFDVGVDCNNYYPLSFDQIRQKMDTLQSMMD